jgi:hypothetical protein
MHYSVKIENVWQEHSGAKIIERVRLNFPEFVRWKQRKCLAGAQWGEKH